MGSTSFLSQDAPACPDWLLKKASGGNAVPMAFVRATSEAVISSATQAYEAGLVIPHLIGEEDEIKQIAADHNLPLEGCVLHHTTGEAQAIETAIALAQKDEILGFVKGQLHTDIFMGALVNREAGMRTDQRMVHLFAMFPPDGDWPLIISDGAVNVAPNEDTRIASSLSIAKLARAIGIETPKIAILSATESVIDSVPSSGEAERVAKAAAAQDDEAEFEGPLSLDLAVSPAAAAQKGIGDSAVAGKANGYVVPDIVSGNILFKSLVWFGGGCAAGLVMGARLPIILTSRSDPATARLASIALGAILSQTR